MPFEIGEGTVLPGMQTSGVRRDLRIALCQIYKVEPGLSAGVLCAGDSGRIIDSFAQPSMDDLYKSFCICSKDRRTPMDYWVSYVAYFYDLNFRETLDIVAEEQYVKRIIGRVPYTNEQTKKTMEELEAMAEDGV